MSSGRKKTCPDCGVEVLASSYAAHRRRKHGGPGPKGIGRRPGGKMIDGVYVHPDDHPELFPPDIVADAKRAQQHKEAIDKALATERFVVNEAPYKPKTSKPKAKPKLRIVKPKVTAQELTDDLTKTVLHFLYPSGMVPIDHFAEVEQWRAATARLLEHTT
jgi:hypothetical protein